MSGKNAANWPQFGHAMIDDLRLENGLPYSCKQCRCMAGTNRHHSVKIDHRFDDGGLLVRCSTRCDWHLANLLHCCAVHFAVQQYITSYKLQFADLHWHLMSHTLT